MSDMDGVENEGEQEEPVIDAENLMKSLKKMMIDMGEGEGLDLDDSASEEEDDYGSEDPVMADYMGRLDSEFGSSKSRRDLPDLNNPEEVDLSVLENLMKSYNAQAGLGGHGPTSSLFQSLGLNPGVPKE